MSRLFQPIPAKPTFGVLHSNTYASDYIKNKRAKIVFCNELKSPYCKKLMTQNEFLNFKRIDAHYASKSLYNKSNLINGLYTKEKLENIDTLCRIEGNMCVNPTTIDPLNVPFYSFYNIDPKGELFGNTPCGINNYTNYMVSNLCDLN
jgi:hypothetical protein